MTFDMDFVSGMALGLTDVWIAEFKQ